MRSKSDYAHVQSLLANGLNDCEVARVTGIPRTTVRDWRRGRVRFGRRESSLNCQMRHDIDAPLQPSYAYLLGMYLGDGDIVRDARTWRLRITLDLAWPGIIDECVRAMQMVFSHNRVSIYRPNRNSNCVVVNVYSNHVVCLFPQHGPGLKYLRRIELADWQQRIVGAYTEKFIRGLIHSDGSRFTNPVTTHKVRYEYSRYMFSNASDNIRGLFTAACDRLGIEWRPTTGRVVAVSRRESVTRLDQFVGPTY